MSTNHLKLFFIIYCFLLQLSFQCPKFGYMLIVSTNNEKFTVALENSRTVLTTRSIVSYVCWNTQHTHLNSSMGPLLWHSIKTFKNLYFETDLIGGVKKSCKESYYYVNCKMIFHFIRKVNKNKKQHLFSGGNKPWMNQSIFPLHSNILPRKDFAHKNAWVLLKEAAATVFGCLIPLIPTKLW